MKMSFFVILFFQVLTCAAQAQFIAGNHGEGVLLNERVYLRDLHLYDQKENLYFGSNNRNIEIFFKMRDFDRLPLTAAQKDLLTRKLEDIESMVRCVGKILADMTYMYSWNFTREVFPVPDEDQDVSRVTLGERVVVAKRFYSEVLIQKKYWDLMPDDHKVALMIHEMMYALLTPISFPHVPGAAIQDVNMVRAVINNLFTDPSVYTLSKFKSQLRYFDITPGISCQKTSSYSVAFSEITGSASFTSRRSETGLTRDLTMQCKKALKYKTGMYITVSTSPYKIQERTYKAFDGKDGANGMGQQTWNRICPATVEIKTGQIFYSKSVEVCVEAAKNFVFNLTDPIEYHPPAEGCL